VIGPGSTVGPFRIERTLGEGAVAEVFEAIREPGVDRVALKVLRPELAADRTFVDRFAHEARAAGTVRHRHLVPVLDAGDAGGVLWLSSELVEGPTLDARIHEVGPLEVSEVVRIAGEVGSGLDALHRAGIVHRDVKPANIVLDPGAGARLTDFGLAKGEAYTVLTKAGQFIGTLDWAAPELVRGEAATSASDVYGLGAVVYACIAGRPPFGDRTMLEAARAILEEDPPDPFARRADGSPALAWAVARALAKDPGRRPPTATAYAHLLRTAADRA
jgi:serine/threonine-protein kinase